MEAAWIPVRRDPYSRHQFALRSRTKGPKTAIIAVARRLAEVLWYLLTEDRLFKDRETEGQA